MNRQQQRSEQGYNDPDSDLDLDLEELDPVSSSHSPPPRRQARSSTDYSGRIPLRNLRHGGRRRQRVVEDDLEPLVADEDALGKREEHAGDDAPLLANGSLRRGSLLDLDAEARSRSWKARLRRLLPFSKRHNAIALANETSEDSTATNRTIQVGSRQLTPYPANAISNAKYTPISFLPVTLWNEFKLFLNLYFLLVALSQVLPALRIGYLSTYVAPLAFVLAVTLGKEGWDDVMRRRRDGEANKEPYVVLSLEGHGRAGTAKERSLSGSKGVKRRKGDRTAELERREEAVGLENEPSARVIEVRKSAKDLAVGDVLVLEKNQRVPADVIILKSIATDAAVSEDVSSAPSRTSEALMDLGEEAGDELHTPMPPNEPAPDAGGEAFIRTDQLDGETDWKLRVAASLTQSLPASEYLRLRVTAGKPDKRVNDFAGTIELLPKSSAAYDPQPSVTTDAPTTTASAPLAIDNTAWANTVLASSTKVHAVVLYTGPQTRAALSTASSRSKIGLLELEINSLVKILCILTAALSLLLVALQRFENDEEERPWYVSVMRFLILFSTIVPISLRVNLDMAKSVYAYLIHRDQGIPGTVVRTSTIPEDLGRIEYLLTDKTGTLTRNEMELRKVHVGSGSYGGEALDEVREFVRLAFAKEEGAADGALWTPSSGYGGLANATRTRREIGVKVRDLVLALAICHNVTPTIDETADGERRTSYQASSPDEIAIVQWTEAVGLRLAHRDRRTMTLHFAGAPVVKVEILNIFPFTSDSKRMGIIVRFYTSLTQPGEDIVFYQKGADT
ncbi:putative aminophospholipid-translocase, partial [Oleoguttula sp. CCFEE 5521]